MSEPLVQVCKGHHKEPLILSFATLLLFIVALLHVLFFVLESLLWTKPFVRRLFGQSESQANMTRTLALNQGFYNLGAAALLVWFFIQDNLAGASGVLLFLAMMGLVGALSANWRIIFIQSVPACVAFALL